MNQPTTSTLPTGSAAGGQHPAELHAHNAVSARAKAIVAALAITQTVGYGSLYYSFAVFLAPVAADLHASRTLVTGAFTTAVLAAAVLAIPVGRWLDRRGSRALMTGGSVAGSLLLVAFAHVDTVVGLYAVWAGIGAVGATVFYEPAFATVIAWTPPARRAQALLAVTVVAGFASSIFLPLTAALVEHHGWRSTALVLAGVHAVITIPLHALVLRRPPQAGPAQASPDSHRRETIRAVVRERRFWLLAVAFTAQAVAISTMSIHLIGILTEAGHAAAFAATITGGLGVLSVTGRLVVTGLTRVLSPASVTAGVFAFQSAAALALIVIAASTPGAIVGVLCFGIGFGVSTIARPALVTGMFGTSAYATIAGMIAAPVTLATALAPLTGAALHQVAGSYAPVLFVVAGACATSATGIALTRRPRWVRARGGGSPPPGG